MATEYREGPVGALMDEYERVTGEFKTLLKSISQDDYIRILDNETQDPDSKSAQRITNHVIRAGYGYANLIRKQFKDPRVERKENYEVPDAIAAERELDLMLAYTLDTLSNKWNLTFEEALQNIMKAGWGQHYDFEQLMEHAIVHVMRHRRQIEKLLRRK